VPRKDRRSVMRLSLMMAIGAAFPPLARLSVPIAADCRLLPRPI
jgi:hypothetical protein